MLIFFFRNGLDGLKIEVLRNGILLAKVDSIPLLCDFPDFLQTADFHGSFDDEGNDADHDDYRLQCIRPENCLNTALGR